jgi:hypothetical protein
MEFPELLAVGLIGILALCLGVFDQGTMPRLAVGVKITLYSDSQEWYWDA